MNQLRWVNFGQCYIPFADRRVVQFQLKNLHKWDSVHETTQMTFSYGTHLEIAFPVQAAITFTHTDTQSRSMHIILETTKHTLNVWCAFLYTREILAIRLSH